MHQLLTIAMKAARRAGSIINRASLELEKVQVSRKGPYDFVTDIDRAAEQAIIESIQEAYPDHAILCEESGLIKGKKAEPEYQWIIDPLDGTKNFIHGLPNYAVSIAVAQKGKIMHGLIYDPNRNEIFTASRGVGAFLNDRRIRVSNRSRLEESLITGRAPAGSSSDATRFYQLVDQSSGYRRLGSTVLELAYVASGRLDGFYGANLQAWDVAAGSLLVLEAGGLIGDFDGEQGWMRSGNVLAASPKLFPLLVQAAQF
ncbi:inositol monophosphatase family protein [Pelistega europaea]|uniref:Inositol-1-monophosphatase n=1 Tax=Pelistega europaea TaxID=106147 RepID=A0A7Y4L9P2_9BURK|nr:inositol monophosphatase family protein [Pelistega europaea]NOL49448.1 inositol monophosphatase [Pelistega europaea]